jgi:YHS domain-containing protein
MRRSSRRAFGTATLTASSLVLAGAAVGIMLGAQPARAAKDPIYTGTFSSLAVSGYDPVSYFTEGRPVEGVAAHETEWNGARWRFASAEHKALFEADPERFAPRFGGYCAWAVSQGYTASSDPLAWKIVNDRLYLNYNLEVQAMWEKDVPGNIVKADGHWPKVLEK